MFLACALIVLSSLALCISKGNAMKRPPTHTPPTSALWDEMAGQAFGSLGLLLLGSTNTDQSILDYVLLFVLAGVTFFVPALIYVIAIEMTKRKR